MNHHRHRRISSRIPLQLQPLARRRSHVPRTTEILKNFPAAASGNKSRVQANVHAITGDVVVKLPLRLGGINTYALAGGGGLIFDPRGNFGGSLPGASTQGRGAFLYGAGADYAFTRHLSLRAEYRGFVYKNPDFGLAAFNTVYSRTHTALLSAGFVYHF